MISVRLLGVVVLCVAASARAADAQDLSHYREYELGSSVSSVTTTSGARTADIKVVHQRPAIIQELVWRPQYVLRSSQRVADPVREIAFSFYNDRLFQIVVMYERDRTEGLTNADLIDALSAVYGVPVIPSARRAAPAAALGPDDLYDGTVVAQWEDTKHRLTLSRGTYPVVFRLVLLSRELAELAHAAATEASRLDDREAPQREADRLTTEITDARAAQEKARVVNKAAFRP